MTDQHVLCFREHIKLCPFFTLEYHSEMTQGLWLWVLGGKWSTCNTYHIFLTDKRLQLELQQFATILYPFIVSGISVCLVKLSNYRWFQLLTYKSYVTLKNATAFWYFIDENLMCVTLLSFHYTHIYWGYAQFEHNNLNAALKTLCLNRVPVTGQWCQTWTNLQQMTFHSVCPAHTLDWQ